MNTSSRIRRSRNVRCTAVTAPVAVATSTSDSNQKIRWHPYLESNSGVYHATQQGARWREGWGEEGGNPSFMSLNKTSDFFGYLPHLTYFSMVEKDNRKTRNQTSSLASPLPFPCPALCFPHPYPTLSRTLTLTLAHPSRLLLLRAS